MKHTLFYNISSVAVALVASLAFSSCNSWLDVKPNNEQVTSDYWKSKEDVQGVITSGYVYMRQAVPTFIKWGELRGGAMYTSNSGDAKLQNFEMVPTDKLCDYSTIYKIINMANSVIRYAPGVNDDTYYEAMRNANLCEAYFLRAYSYLVLVKNFKEVPLVIEPYVDDKNPFDIAKSTEEDIIKQIKADVEAALATGAAKGTYETEWQTKGRVSKWALYALMADACVWSEDYAKAVEYCDKILYATDAFRPAFMTNTNDWFTIFYPGNSNESIFELNWDYNKNQETNNFHSLFEASVNSPLMFTTRAIENMREETKKLLAKGYSSDSRMGRMLLATYIPETGTTTGWTTSNNYYMWKYRGTDVQDIAGGVRANQDAHFIIYRVAEIVLLKAQAEIMRGNYLEALKLIDKVRVRAGLDNFNDVDPESADAQNLVSQLDELTLLEEVINQKEMEFYGEGKRWYDLLWLGRIQGGKYKKQFVAKVIEGNQTANSAWLRSVLQNSNAWYMPLSEDELQHNKLLKQNPYYAGK